MERVKVGIVGNGNISPIYLKNLTQTFKNIVDLKGVCDLIPERSAKAAADWNVPVIYKDMYEMFADPEIEIVLNLTTPGQHYGVAIEALRAGKNTHSEKPMSINRENARERPADRFTGLGDRLGSGRRERSGDGTIERSEYPHDEHGPEHCLCAVLLLCQLAAFLHDLLSFFMSCPRFRPIGRMESRYK